MSEMDKMIVHTKIVNELVRFSLHKPLGQCVEAIEKLIEEQAEIRANEKYKAICEATDNLFKP